LPAQKEAALFKKSAQKLLIPQAGFERPVSAMRDTHMAETGLTPPAYGTKVFWILFFKKVSACLF
jgi:hypothetical protein